MAAKGTEFHALEQKLRVAAETVHEAEILQTDSRRALAAYLEVDYDRLKSAWQAGRRGVSAVGTRKAVPDPQADINVGVRTIIPGDQSRN